MVLIINDVLQICFIHIPKTGGMYIKNSLLTNYNFKEIDIIEYKTINEIEKIIKRCNNFIEKGYSHYLYKEIMDYKYFCFVRNPYERFISGIIYMNIAKDGFNNINEVINNMENYKNCLVNSPSRDVELYAHLFVLQCHFIKNIPNITILKYENLNNSFSGFLLKNGIKEITHDKTYINKSIYKKNFWEYYDINLLNFINNYFDEDFKNFGYEKYNNILDFYYNMNKKYKPYKNY